MIYRTGMLDCVFSVTSGMFHLEQSHCKCLSLSQVIVWNVTFNITARDAQNHTLYVTDANLTSGYVFVDTIKPNLTINGNDVPS